MEKPIIRSLTEADIRDFYGKNYDQPCRGWAIEYEGHLAAIVGITITPTLMLCWSDIKPGVRASTRTILETAKILMIKIRQMGYPILFAVANPEQKNARVFLSRLGWDYIESSARGDVFMMQVRGN